jgi:voltage-gated potassium channel
VERRRPDPGLSIEAEIGDEQFHGFWDGVWWAVATVTTVGYGDVVPSSVPGRLVAIVVMLTGIGFLAVLTATISSHFVKADRQDESSEILESLQRLEADVAELKARLS